MSDGSIELMTILVKSIDNTIKSDDIIPKCRFDSGSMAEDRMTGFPWREGG